MLFRIDIGRWKLRLKVFLNLPEVTKLVNGEVRITISYNFRHTILLYLSGVSTTLINL